jgi:leucyl aminopeptidase
MDIKLRQGSAATLDADTIITPAFEKQGATHPLNDATGGWFHEIYESGEFSGNANEVIVFHRPAGMKAKRLMVVGLGPQEKVTTVEFRRAVSTAVRHAKARPYSSVVLALDAGFDGPEWIRASVEGAVLGQFDPDHHKTDPKKTEKRVDLLEIAVQTPGPDAERAIHEGRVIGDSQNITRELVNTPANLLTPLQMADRARKVAAEVGLDCEILDGDRMRQLGMGALLGVAQGSYEPPALIILRYNPQNAATADHLGLVGKGVTFDTGGNSMKPAEGMEKMKYDMAGGAAVIGAMRAIALLKPAVRVTGFIPAVENMVGSRAQRPGDIVTTLNGKTVEVLNTDAEGRLILIDAITYAIRQGCTHLVDAATLTGAVAVALGHIYVGAFTNNDELLQKLFAAAKVEGERMWQLPLDEDYKDYLKSAFADLPNIGGRYGGAITAAYFLKEFTEGKPWVHLDIAGTAWLDDAKPYMSKGPTGLPVRTFVRLAQDWTAAR